MRIDAIPIGKNPPDEVNVIIEVPIGGEPIKYEMDKAAGALVVDRFLYTPMRYPGQLRLHPAHAVGRRRPDATCWSPTRAPIVPGAVMAVRPVGVLMMEDEAGGDEKIIAVPVAEAHPALRQRAQLHRPARDHAASRSSTSSSTTRISSPANGSRSSRWGDAEEAHRLILEAIERAKAKGG